MILDCFRLEGKVALVTGSRRGLGSAIAIALAEAGADVVCHGREDEPGGTCTRIKALGRDTAYFAMDLARPEGGDRLITEVVRRCGRVDVLVNNAGVIHRAPAESFAKDQWDEVIAVNLSSVFRLSQAAGQQMLKAGRGKIVNVASLLSFQGGITVPAYAAAKGGVAQLTKALANEWAHRGINVNALAPGYMATDNTKPLRDDPVRSRQILERIPAGRWGEPADVAGAAVFLCSSASDYVHGHLLVVDGGWMGR